MGLVAATLIAGAVSVIVCCPMLVYMLHPAVKKCFTGGVENFHDLREIRVKDEKYQVKKEQIESERKLIFELLHSLHFPVLKDGEVAHNTKLPEELKRKIIEFAFPEQYSHVQKV
jgi:hypothetical protein